MFKFVESGRISTERPGVSSLEIGEHRKYTDFCLGKKKIEKKSFLIKTPTDRLYIVLKSTFQEIHTPQFLKIKKKKDLSFRLTNV